MVSVDVKHHVYLRTIVYLVMYHTSVILAVALLLGYCTLLTECLESLLHCSK